MPIQIKDPRTKKLLADGVVGNTIKCGHCEQPILDGTGWIALDDPYFCLIHDTCKTIFKYNGMLRSARGDGRKMNKKALDDDCETLLNMTTKPWWNKRGVPISYQKALKRLLLVHQSLRVNGILMDPDDGDKAVEKGSTTTMSREGLLKATDTSDVFEE